MDLMGRQDRLETADGRIYLREFAVFEALDRCFLQDVQAHRATPIARAEYDLLYPLAGQWDAPTDSPAMDALRGHGLLSPMPLSDEKVLARDTRLSRALMEATAIRTFFLHIAQRCNMACAYCYANQGDFHHGGMMTVETARACVDFIDRQVPQDVCTTICFTGGEPLMNFPVLRDCVLYAQQKRPSGIRFQVVTNLTLLDEDMLSFFASHAVDISVSMDGPPEYQRRNRPMRDGRDSYAVVAQKIAMARGRIAMTASATRYAGDDYDAIDRALMALGFAGRSIRVARASTHGQRALEDYARELEERTARLARLGQALSGALVRRDAQGVREALSDTIHGEWLAFCLRTPFQKGRKHITFCAAAREQVGISVEGDIYPCVQFNEVEAYRMGSVHTGLERGVFGLHGAVYNPACRRCHARYACEGFCMNQALELAPKDCEYPPVFYVPPAHCALQKLRLCIHAYLGSAMDEGTAGWLREHVQAH